MRFTRPGARATKAGAKPYLASKASRTAAMRVLRVRGVRERGGGREEGEERVVEGCRRAGRVHERVDPRGRSTPRQGGGRGDEEKCAREHLVLDPQQIHLLEAPRQAVELQDRRTCSGDGHDGKREEGSGVGFKNVDGRGEGRAGGEWKEGRREGRRRVGRGEEGGEGSSKCRAA